MIMKAVRISKSLVFFLFFSLPAPSRFGILFVPKKLIYY